MTPKHTGDTCVTSGVYQAKCGCPGGAWLRRGDFAPKCPKCGRDVDWTFVRPMQTAPDSPPAKPIAKPPKP